MWKPVLDNEPALALTIIDLGESIVVKREVGEWPDSVAALLVGTYGESCLGGTGAIKALSTLTGKPLPVYNGGMWKPLIREPGTFPIFRYTR